MNLYSIYDQATQKFGTPWASANDNQAKRSYERLASDKTTDIAFRPSDFRLMALGYFDESTGYLEAAVQDITPPLAS